MSDTKTGGPAFPILQECEGMTLRDYMAAKALQGFCANPSVFAPSRICGWGLVNSSDDQLAEYAYILADAMLRARGQ